MNKGEYLVANSDTFGTNYKDREYFDVYSKPIKSLYSQVHWKSHGQMPLPEDIVQRFSNGKLMAITGYEVDQIRKLESGEEVSVPITWAYNHHYVTYILNSKKAKLVKKKTPTTILRRGMSHGAAVHWQAEVFGVEEDQPNEVPQVHMFSEGNGGEMRLSYHGYPKGYAQIIESPDTYMIAPMQIDTWNRNMQNATFQAGPLPRSSRIPPEAGYSGLLECPCTDRIDFEWGMTYALEESGTCTAPVQNATECSFAVQQTIKSERYNARSVSDKTLPPGCSGMLNDKSAVDAVWNSAAMEANEDRKVGDIESQAKLLGVALGIVNMTVAIDETKGNEAVHLKFAGPSDKWFGVGFGSDSMCLTMQGDECPVGGPYTVIVSGEEVTERKLDFHGPGVVLARSLKVESNEVENGIRYVHLSRPLNGPTSKHYAFDMSTSTIPLIMATGCSLAFAQHCAHSPNQVNVLPVDVPKAICQAGIEGTIGGVRIKDDRCAPFPGSDLLVQDNPTCHVETYVGGIHCCPHGAFLLDSDQEIPWKDEPLEYYLKFRFYFEEFKEVPTVNDSPSHQQLIRPYWQTEAHAGEYDVVECKAGTPQAECVQVITARWKVRDMMIDCPIHDASWCTGKGSTNSSVTKGIKFIYIGPHCHAGTCLSMELYNADTGRLLCQIEPRHGKGQNPNYDEQNYLAIPPCLWGHASEGLPEPELLSLETTLLAIKRNNNTFPHTGEMASWQMRAIVVSKEEKVEMEESVVSSAEPQLRRTWAKRNQRAGEVPK